MDEEGEPPLAGFIPGPLVPLVEVVALVPDGLLADATDARCRVSGRLAVPVIARRRAWPEAFARAGNMTCRHHNPPSERTFPRPKPSRIMIVVYSPVAPEAPRMRKCRWCR